MYSTIPCYLYSFFFFLFLNVTQRLLHILILCSKPYFKSISSSVTFSILPSIPFHISLLCSSFFSFCSKWFPYFLFYIPYPFIIFIHLGDKFVFGNILYRGCTCSNSSSNNSVLDRHGTSSFSIFTLIYYHFPPFSSTSSFP